MFTSDDIEVFTQSSIRITDRGRRIDHYDHFSSEDIAKVTSGKSVLIIPEKLSEAAQQVAGSVGKIVTVTPGTCAATLPAYPSAAPTRWTPGRPQSSLII